MKLDVLLINLIFVFKNLIPIINQSREKLIAAALLKHNLKISTAESCTGGLISSRLTDISGSSAFIFQNFVTYANEAKISLLDVNLETVQKYGVVSSQVALEMVKGLLTKYNCDIAVSTTGIAGPLGATETKPVGLIFIAIANRHTSKVYQFNAPSMLCRRLMKYSFSDKAFDLLLDFLKDQYN